MTKVLFIGNYLSKNRGTKTISEKIQAEFYASNIEIKLCSRFENKIIRFLDIIFTCLTSNYDKVFVDTFSGLYFRIPEFVSLVVMLRRKKLILTLHGGALPEFYENSPKKVHKVFNRALYIQTPSIYLQNYFSQHGFKLNYLPNSVDLKKFPFKRINRKPYSMLWVRAFSTIYNPLVPIKIVSHLQKKYPDIQLTMIGPDKGLQEEVIKLINELDLVNYVTITGPIQNDQLFPFYQSHQVFLNTTSYESFGVAVLEAASCGITIVSSKVGEIPFIWTHNENILMVDEIVPELYAEQIEKLFESEELNRYLSLNARIKAEEFDWEIIKSKWQKLLSE